MSSFIKNNIFLNLILAILFLFFNSCSEKEEASDFEKLGAGATTSSSGTIQGNVVDFSGSSGLSGVSISFSLSGTSIATNSTDSNGDFSQSSLPLGTYTLSYSKSGYISASQSGTLETDNQTLATAKLTMLPSSCGSGYITGTIKNAVNGDDVSSVSLSARSGINVTTGTALKSATTADNGTYSIGSLDAGLYTVLTSKNGYIPTSFNVRLCGGASGQNANISESLPDGAMRIITSWEGTEDFDSHLEIPVSGDGDSDLNDPSHLWYGSTQATNAVYNGVTTKDYHIYTDIVNDGSDNVTLDNDNLHGTCSAAQASASQCATNRTGPETVTISKLRSGTYRFHVYAYDQSGNTNSRHIADNATALQVCYNNSCTNLYPPSSVGNLWTVFDYSISGGLTPLNVMANESNDGRQDDH